MAAVELYQTPLFADASLQGYWRFENNGVDETANNNDLTLSGTPAYDVGKFNQGIDLESTSSQYGYINDGDQTGLDITGPLTISAWVKPETIGIFQTVASKYNLAGPQISYRLIFNTTNTARIEWASDGGPSTEWFDSDSAFLTDAGVWAHIVVTLVPSTETAIIYKDGSPVASTKTGSGITSIYNSTTPFAIGARYNTTAGGFFDGIIDDVAVFNRALTAIEVSNLYNGAWYLPRRILLGVG